MSKIEFYFFSKMQNLGRKIRKPRNKKKNCLTVCLQTRLSKNLESIENMQVRLLAY